MLELLSMEIKIFLLSMLPIIELRGAIPIGIGKGLSYGAVFIVCYLGSLVPAPIILLGSKFVFRIMKNTKLFGPLTEKIREKSMRNAGKKIQKYGTLGLLIFVAIPLPGTGVWTGSIAASIMNLRFKYAMFAIIIGNLIAGLIILGLSGGLFSIIL